MPLTPLIASALLAISILTPLAGCQARSAGSDIEAAMVEAATFFRDQLSVEGSYVWEYDADDLSERRGEGITTLSQGWSEPPGTPAVGLAYLSAFKATGRPFFLDAAKETATALIRTQLESGGWQGLLEFDPDARTAWCYRIDMGRKRPDCDDIEDNDVKDATSIDDNISQSSLTFLMRLDEELGGEWVDLREVVTYGLERFLEAQYPNGAWPFRFDFKVSDELTSSAWRARYPSEWARRFVEPEREVYVVNDHMVRDAVRMFLLAYHVYGESAYLAAAKRGGDFLLAAQMPEPQPGWAQTYNSDLEPIWGRPFEPPSLASNESAGSVEALLDLFAATGEARYLAGASSAVRWLGRSRLPNGHWARFYELESNRPLYVDADYEVTYSDDDLPEHYSFTGPFGIMDVLKHYRRIAADGAAAAEKTEASPIPKEAKVVAFIDALDEDGRWLDGDVIASGTFVKRLTALASFLAAQQDKALPDYLRPIKHQLAR